MVRWYYLLVELVNDVEQVRGIDLIHDAVLLTTDDSVIRKLIMDTTDDEHAQLDTVALGSYVATPSEIDLYNNLVTITPLSPDILRAQELLHRSPDVITQPEQWELLRIYGRLLSIPE